MWPSVRRCSTTTCPSSLVWTWTRTRSPRSREPLDPSHTRTGFASRCAGPAVAEGVDAGAACSSRVKSETITRAAFRLPKLTPAAPGESRLGRVAPRAHVRVALAIRHDRDAADDEEGRHHQDDHAGQHCSHDVYGPPAPSRWCISRSASGQT